MPHGLLAYDTLEICHFFRIILSAIFWQRPLPQIFSFIKFKAANSPTDLELMGIVDFSENGKKVMVSFKIAMGGIV